MIAAPTCAIVLFPAPFVSKYIFFFGLQNESLKHHRDFQENFNNLLLDIYELLLIYEKSLDI